MKIGLRVRMAAAAVAMAAGLAAPAARAETLADALAYGYEHSGLLEQNRALLRVADEDVAQAVSSILPVVNWVASTTMSFPDSGFTQISVGNTSLTATLGISASLTLYDGGANRLAIDVQKETVLATRQALLGIEQQVLLRIVEAYVEVLRSEAFVNTRENNVRLITEELRAAQDRFDVGEVTRTDVAQAESRLAAARSQLANDQGARVRAYEEFVAAVGRAPTNLELSRPAQISQSIPEAKALALRIHPALIEAQHNVTASELNILRAEAAVRPNLSISARAGLNEELDQSASVGLELSGPIYQGGRLASQIRQTIARRDATRANLLVTADTIEQNVGNAYSFLEVARASIQASDQQVQAATVAFEGIREEATLGARTTLDVLDAEQELLDARVTQISARADEVIASYSLLATMGLLTAENLNLRVQIYDPTAYYNLVDDAPVALSAQGQALDRVLEAIGGN